MKDYLYERFSLVKCPFYKGIYKFRLVSGNFRIVLYSIYPASRYVSALVSRCYIQAAIRIQSNKG